MQETEVRIQKTEYRRQKTEDRRHEDWGWGEWIMDQRGAANFKELIVWQKAHKFVLGIYTFTETFRQRKHTD
jgi:hypothetical protein